MNRTYLLNSFFVAVILAMFVASFLPSAEKKKTPLPVPEASVTSSPEHIQQAVNRFLLRTVPRKDDASIIQISPPVNLSQSWRFRGGRRDFTARIDGIVDENAWQPVGKEGVAIAVEFGSRGSSGVRTTKNAVLFLGRDWRLLEVVDRDNFSPHNPTGEKPEQFESFVEQYGGGVSYGSVE